MLIKSEEVKVHHAGSDTSRASKKPLTPPISANKIKRKISRFFGFIMIRRTFEKLLISDDYVPISLFIKKHLLLVDICRPSNKPFTLKSDESIKLEKFNFGQPKSFKCITSFKTPPTWHCRFVA